MADRLLTQVNGQTSRLSVTLECEIHGLQDATNKKDAKPGPEGGGAAGGGGRRGGDKNQDKHPAFDKPKASFPYGVKKSEMSGRKGGGGGKRH